MTLFLRAMCGTKQLENYNRRDNVNVFGLDEIERTDKNGNAALGNQEETMQKVLQLENRQGAKLDEKDNSITHRIPTSKKDFVRPMEVRPSRRVAEV